VLKRKAAHYDLGVGARITQRRDESVQRRKAPQERLTLWKIIAALVIPVFLALGLVAMDMRSDLDAPKSSGHIDDKGALALGWSELGGWHDSGADSQSAPRWDKGAYECWGT
jgi:hypothetical protein